MTLQFHCPEESGRFSKRNIGKPSTLRLLSLPREMLVGVPPDPTSARLEESFKNLSFNETSAKRIIIYIVQTIFIKYAMELGNPNLDEVQWNCLPEREKVIIERSFKEKWWKHLLIFPRDLHRARLRGEEAGLDNLLVLFPRQFPDPSNLRREPRQ